MLIILQGLASSTASVPATNSNGAKDIPLAACASCGFARLFLPFQVGVRRALNLARAARPGGPVLPGSEALGPAACTVRSEECGFHRTGEFGRIQPLWLLPIPPSVRVSLTSFACTMGETQTIEVVEKARPQVVVVDERHVKDTSTHTAASKGPISAELTC